MCRLFGFRSNVPSRAHRSLVAAENALGRQARSHKDGWGIGYFVGGDAYIMKSDTSAANDERFSRLSSRLQSNTMVVHVRRATVGTLDQLNCHPFRHGAWMFAHNGTIFGFDDLLPRMMPLIREDLRPLIFGTTDSEHLFYFLVSELDRAGISDHGRGTVEVERGVMVLRQAFAQLYDWAREAGQPPPIANYILTNGKVFFAQRAGMGLYMATQKTDCPEFDTCSAPNKRCLDVARPLFLSPAQLEGPPRRRVSHLLVASEKISDVDIWEEIPDGTMVALDEEFHLYVRPGPRGYEPPSPDVLDSLARGAVKERGAP